VAHAATRRNAVKDRVAHAARLRRPAAGVEERDAHTRPTGTVRPRRARRSAGHVRDTALPVAAGPYARHGLADGADRRIGQSPPARIVNALAALRSAVSTRRRILLLYPDCGSQPCARRWTEGLPARPIRRQPIGVVRVIFEKVLVKWLWSAKPQDTATSAIGRPVCLSNVSHARPGGRAASDAASYRPMSEMPG